MAVYVGEIKVTNPLQKTKKTHTHQKPRQERTHAGKVAVGRGFGNLLDNDGVQHISALNAPSVDAAPPATAPNAGEDGKMRAREPGTVEITWRQGKKTL